MSDHAEEIARAFHDAYEMLAPQFGYRTRMDSAVPWEAVPDSNKALMVATVEQLLADGSIAHPSETFASFRNVWPFNVPLQPSSAEALVVDDRTWVRGSIR